MIKRPRLISQIKDEVIDENPDENIDVTKPDDPSPILKCELCDTICCSISQLQTHTLSQHVNLKRVISPTLPTPPAQKLSCQQCDAQFDGFAQFAHHMKAHLSSTPSDPPPSSSSSAINTTTSSSLTSSPPPSVTLYCPMCPLMTFLDANSRLEHITLQHLQMRVSQHFCSHCDVSFLTAPMLTTHFTQCHMRIKYECKVCTYSCDNEKMFKEHSRSHSRQEISLGCMACACTFPTQKVLLAHVQLCHSQDQHFFSNSRPILPATSKSSATPLKSAKPFRPLTCSVCDETVIGEDGLDEHRLLRHCKVRYADKCADCHEPITTNEEFVEHCAKHAKDLTIHCPVCRQTLRSDVQIHAHKAYHMESPPPSIEKVVEDDFDLDGFSFTCPVCGEKFDNAMKLIEHGFSHAS